MRTALVTGSEGFIGRHVRQSLERDGYAVFACDLRERVYPGDCRDVFRHEIDGCRLTFDLVVHCAALVNGRETIDGNPATVAAYNLQLDAAMFEWALRARPGRIVYLSSSAAYPVRLQGGGSFGTARPLMEGRPGLPHLADQTYGYVKAVGERLAVEVRAAGVPVTVVRPFSGYGADQDGCYPFPAMIARALARKSPFDVWGDGRQVRDFVHVDDICAAVLAL
ncbi:MAG: NAD-dependent epimerase/dehydratase family protein, partial [Chloroflexota bacterium]|nr:NAD-dependent epimerase/dehydratase family protein [Chloroflexota bacterium]